MAKIWKSTRKQHKSLKAIYWDAQLKWRMSLDYNKTPQDIGSIREIEKEWFKAGGKRKQLYSIGIKKARDILSGKIQCKTLFK